LVDAAHAQRVSALVERHGLLTYRTQSIPAQAWFRTLALYFAGMLQNIKSRRERGEPSGALVPLDISAPLVEDFCKLVYQRGARRELGGGTIGGLSSSPSGQD